MNWKTKACIVATLLLLYGANTSVVAQENVAELEQDMKKMSDTEKEREKTEARLRQSPYDYWSRDHIQTIIERDYAIQNRDYSPLEVSIRNWKTECDNIATAFKTNHTHWLLRPISELCAAYQSMGDFTSAQIYLQQGEEIIKEHEKEILKYHMADIPLFQTVALFNKIGQGEITPAEAQAEAITLLNKENWLMYAPWCEFELLDIIKAAVDSPDTFSKTVAEIRYNNDIIQRYEGRPAKMAQYVARILHAAGIYEDLLGQRDNAKRIVNAAYQRVEGNIRSNLASYEAMALMSVLGMKFSYEANDRNHPEAIKTAEKAFQLYTILPKKYILQDALAGIFGQACLSYDAMGKRGRWGEICKTLLQDNDSKGFTVSLLKCYYIFSYKNEFSEEEIRQALLDLQAAADRECEENPDNAPAMRGYMQEFSKMLSEPWASIIRPEPDDQNVQPSRNQPGLSAIRLLNEAIDAFNNKDYVNAMSLFDRYLQSTYAKMHGHANILALRGLARSTLLAGTEALLKKGNKAEWQSLEERSFDCYMELINRHEKDRENYYSGIPKEERGKWFANVIKDYRDAVWAFEGCPPGIKKYAYFKRAIFDTMEKCKARILLERYAEQLADGSGVLTKAELELLRSYQLSAQRSREKLLHLEEAKDHSVEDNWELKNAYYAWEHDAAEELKYRKSLQEKYPLYRTLSSPKILTSHEGQQLLPQNTVFFEYLMDSNNIGDYWAFLSLSANDINSYMIDHPASKDEWDAYCKLLSFRKYKTSETEVSENDFSYVYRLWKIEKQENVNGYYYVVQPKGDVPPNAKEIDSQQGFENVRKELAEKWGTFFDYVFTKKLGIQHGMKLIISPDDAVPILPFETLTCGGKSFAELYEISYAPSLSVYALMRERGEANAALAERKDLFAMGNAVYGYTDGASLASARESNFRELPGTATELGEVGALFPDEKQKSILQREDASESTLKSLDQSGELAQYKYLLFATHGIFNEENPLANAIVLSHPDKQKTAASDGYVTVGEWMGYNLHSDLVYLSACETGRGANYAGEGFVGLPYALTIAGNKSTVMTLWEIDDEAAAAFSSEFFARLAEGKIAGQALAETKREFLHHENLAYRDPYVWGAFQLYGE